MPIFSLPSPYGIGTFGRAAYEFIDQLKARTPDVLAGASDGTDLLRGQPRTSPTLHLREIPYFIDLDTLKDEKLLTQDEIDACWWCDKQDQVKL